MATRVIGLAGRAGSGKSAVAQALASRGDVEWIELDRLAWETYRPGTETFDRLIERFGREVLGADGAIDRGRLAEWAFSTPASRDDLEAIVHPAVMALLREAIAAHRQLGIVTILVEGALLVHSPHVDRTLFDAIVWLDVDERTRAERLRADSRPQHGRRVPEPSPEAFDGVRRLSAEGTVADVAARLQRLTETV